MDRKRYIKQEKRIKTKIYIFNSSFFYIFLDLLKKKGVF